MVPRPEPKVECTEPTAKPRHGSLRAYAGEPLRLAGYFNKWSTSDPQSCFQQVHRRPPLGVRELEALHFVVYW
eukprot:9309839-Alexandrium_andersonii.AAC.1